MKHPKPNFRLGLAGALLAWGSYGLILCRGLPWVMIYANESGSRCATVRLGVQAHLMELAPCILLFAGIGWGISVISRNFVRTARLGFIASALTSLFCLGYVN